MRLLRAESGTHTIVYVRSAVAIILRAAPTDVRLTSFEHLSTVDVEAAIANVPNKSSAADLFLVPVLKAAVDLLSPFFLHSGSTERWRLDSFRAILRTLS